MVARWSSLKAYGLADRARSVAVTPSTQFGIASGTKGLTALMVMSLVEEGALELGTTARSLLGADLPLVDDEVTVEQLLAHRSGIGDYMDEENDDLPEYPMPVPVQELATTEQYLAVLGGFPMFFPPGSAFRYSNGGYVVLALLAERAAGATFHDLVRERVCEPAGLASTAFLRSDELPGEAAVGYVTVDSPRTNVFHLPVRGSGDGGIYSTVEDVSTLWAALLAGRIVAQESVTEMLRPRSDVPQESLSYGLGFWLHPATQRLELHGYDVGVSFRSIHDPAASTTWTVVSNTGQGTWPLETVLEEHVG